MKNVVTRLMVAGIALAGATALYAQERTVIANVPFSFYMGAKAMPQGAYRVDEFKSGNLISIRSAHVNKLSGAWSISGKEVETPRLVFKCYGDSCFLSQVWTGYTSRGLQLPGSSRERELASNGASATLAVIKLALQ